MRRTINLFVLLLCSAVYGQDKTEISVAAVPQGRKMPITQMGAVGDGKTLNTKAIQSAVDGMAAAGGGTLVVPQGVFISGSLFLKPGVNLHLDKGGVLKCSTDPNDFPRKRTRIEGHFEESFNAGLINADGCDGLCISGSGMLDGSGMPVWEKFWAGRKVDKNFKNLGLDRARLAIIENSKDVKISGITFKDSQFWNLHIYNCQKVVVENTSFIVPDDYKQAPSTDGIDLDSCQDVVVRGCFFSVTDDCICLKGTKGPFALEDKQSRPTERIRISDCTFKRGEGVATCGSEATLVRDVVVSNCKITGPVTLVRLKLRPDTPQHYEDIHFRDITIENDKMSLFQVRKWSQYFDLRGQPEPKSIVRNITVSNIKGTIGSLGEISGNRETDISDITIENVDVKAKDTKFTISDKVKNVDTKNVTINGRPFSLQ
ncbi:MAG: exopolygalacturonase [Planctomycetes bacterium]|nr:exopolygalacturonase [Planctomycetota bacterium]